MRITSNSRPWIGSLRGRLLLWYTAMLASVIIVFGSIVCYLAWRTRLADIDDRLRARAEMLAQGLQPAAAGTFDLVLPRDEPEASEDGAYHALWSSGGALIDRSDSDFDIRRPDGPGLHTRDGRRELTIRVLGADVLVGVHLDQLRGEIEELAATMAAVAVAALAVSLLGGWYLVGRALTPVNRINLTARAMIDGDFTARVPVDGIETELGQLARALNDAFDRLHAALERQRRFTADASHELRTPLATVAIEAQWALGRERRPDEYRHSLEVCRRASARMQGVVERLLALARAEMLPQTGRFPSVNLEELAATVVHDVRPLSDARRLDVRIEAVPVVCHGDRDGLLDAVTNVVVNAIEYNVEHGHIRIEVRETREHAEVVVSDTGAGIAAEHLPYVFEPFFRADAARSRTAGGSGLGLALTRTTVRRHGGDVFCTSEPGRGTTVTIRLPRFRSVGPRLLAS